MKRFKVQLTCLAFMMLILSVFLITGCGGSDEAALLTAQYDNVLPGACTEAGPKVILSNPTNNDEGVSVSTAGVANGGKSITVNFSEAMDPTTIVVTDSGNPEVLTFTLRDNDHPLVNIEGTVAMSLSNTVATFTTIAALNGDSWYTATITTYAKSVGGTSLGCSYQWQFKTGLAETVDQASVNLGTAGDFVILSKTGITEATPASTHITGNIGTSPITGAAITLACSEMVTGTIYTVDATGPACRVVDPTRLTTAISDMETAYTDAAGRTIPDFTNLYAGILDGQTLVPGLYKYTTGVTIGSTPGANVTLSGGANDVWIFQISGDLTLANGSSVKLIGGALAKNVFWQVGGPTGAILGTTSTFEGNILSAKQVTIASGAVLNGRALAQTQVTLNGNTITVPAP
jgi:hypothetical protein